MPAYVPQHLDRFLSTLRVVSKEVTHLQETHKRLFKEGSVSVNWVKGLTADDPAQDTLEAFASRFGRLQDSLADKLLPRLALLEGEKPGSAIDNLNHAERLGLISSAKGWLAMRVLRNKLVHEYVEDPSEFASALTNTCVSKVTIGRWIPDSLVGTRCEYVPVSSGAALLAAHGPD